MNKLGKLFLKGLAVAIPLVLTLAILWWMATGAERLLGGLLKACEKRPISTRDLEHIVDVAEARLHGLDELLPEIGALKVQLGKRIVLVKPE